MYVFKKRWRNWRENKIIMPELLTKTMWSIFQSVLYESVLKLYSFLNYISSVETRTFNLLNERIWIILKESSCTFCSGNLRNNNRNDVAISHWCMMHMNTWSWAFLSEEAEYYYVYSQIFVSNYLVACFLAIIWYVCTYDYKVCIMMILKINWKHWRHI